MRNPFDIPADLDTPTSVFLKLRPLAPRFLLESVEHGDRVGRYSFIGFGDGLDVRSDGHAIDVGSQRLDTDGSMGGLMDGLRKALGQAPQLDTGDVPFNGGLVGYVGFNVAHRFTGAIPPPSADSEIVLYGPPSVIAFDHLTRRAALFHAGSEAERLSLRAEVMDLLDAGLRHERSPGSHAPPTLTMGKPEFLAAVDRAHEHIAAGDVYQLVLSVGFSGEADLDPFDVYRGLRLLNPSPYLYYFDAGDAQIIGSSPEALVTLRDGRAHLRPIAGTRPLTADDAANHAAEVELLGDPKEAAEHVMLVDLARNDLGRVAVPGSIEVAPYRAIERYSHVMHLVSGVTGLVETPHDAFDLFGSAFPAGTVVGAPKARALELLDEIEPAPRNHYAGTVGYFGHGGAMDHAITIRTVVLSNGSYTYQAGAGIVADSVPEAEWEEIQSKAGAMRGALEIASGGEL